MRQGRKEVVSRVNKPVFFRRQQERNKAVFLFCGYPAEWKGVINKMEKIRPKYYITTAIAYTSGKPHIGNTYEIVLADSIARFKRQQERYVNCSSSSDITFWSDWIRKRKSMSASIRSACASVSVLHRRLWRNLPF